MTKTLVIFYSTYGHVYRLAEAVAKGAKEVAGNEVTLKRIKETLPHEVLEKLHAVEAQKAFEHIPVLEDPNELTQYDTILFGTPTRFGGLPAQTATFIDRLGGLWLSGATVGKVAGVFVSTASQHGGQETTIRALHTTLLHLGFVIVGLPYAFKGQLGVSEVLGGSPYGATTIAGGQGERLPSEIDLAGGTFLGRHVSEIGKKVAGK